MNSRNKTFTIPDDLDCIIHPDGSITVEPGTKKEVGYNYELLMSLPALAKGWDTPEEDKAWMHLQRYAKDSL